MVLLLMTKHNQIASPSLYNQFPEWPGRLASLVQRCQFPSHTLEIQEQETHRWFLRVVLTGSEWKGRWWRLSPHMTDGEIVQTAFKAVQTFMEHEVREAFTFDGVAVFGPHLDIHELVKLHKEGKAVRERK